jgi:hypothetical protein
MVGKAQKSHGARSGLYGGCSNGVPPIHFFQAEHRIQFRSLSVFVAWYLVKYWNNLGAGIAQWYSAGLRDE